MNVHDVGKCANMYMSKCECQKRTCEVTFISVFLCLFPLSNPQPKSVQGLEVIEEHMERVQSCKVFMNYWNTYFRE